VLTFAIIFALALTVALVALWTLFHPTDWAVKRIGEFYPGVLFRVTTIERAVALTIDDAPHPDVTPGILRELRTHGAKATFFIIGQHAAAHPDLVQAIRADGHELANHFYTDRMSARLNDVQLADELTRTDALIQPLGAPRWCRAGSGVLTARMVRLMQAHGYTAVAGTAYPVDLYTNVRLTVLHFLQNVRPGAVLVLHDGGPRRANSVRTVSLLLPRIREMGYRIVSLGELTRLAGRS
jgi:peptidoglycan/xylan/chitin deacetylase (PgdA/CDA1 family)